MQSSPSMMNARPAILFNGETRPPAALIPGTQPLPPPLMLFSEKGNVFSALLPSNPSRTVFIFVSAPPAALPIPPKNLALCVDTFPHTCYVQAWCTRAALMPWGGPSSSSTPPPPCRRSGRWMTFWARCCRGWSRTFHRCGTGVRYSVMQTAVVEINYSVVF